MFDNPSPDDFESGVDDLRSGEHAPFSNGAQDPHFMDFEEPPPLGGMDGAGSDSASQPQQSQAPSYIPSGEAIGQTISAAGGAYSAFQQRKIQEEMGRPSRPPEFQSRLPATQQVPLRVPTSRGRVWTLILLGVAVAGVGVYFYWKRRKRKR